MRRDGGFRLESPPNVAADQLTTYAEEAGYADAHVIVLTPYVSIPKEVYDVVDVLEELGSTITRAKAAIGEWPPKPAPRMDEKFLNSLFQAICDDLDRRFPAPADIDPHREVQLEILRGLVSHSKMGPNNHSHEDDLWKARGRDLRPGEKRDIVNALTNLRILGSKKNDSMGGKGTVYWVDNVATARQLFPELNGYFNDGREQLPRDD